MTAYHGGKQKSGLEIAEIIVDTSIEISIDEKMKIKGYCEPFCGMLGVYQHIPFLFEEEGIENLQYKAGDINHSVIAMWKSAQNGWTPPTKSNKEEYEKFKNTTRSSAKKGFIGHACSFGGVYLSSYQSSRCKTLSSSSQNVINIANDLYDVNFKSGEYTMFSHLKGYRIYCDPPYKNHKNKNNNYYDESKNLIRFDHEKFWKWCKMMSMSNIVFVTEFSTPLKDIQIIKNLNKLLGSKGNKGKQTEKLYLL